MSTLNIPPKSEVKESGNIVFMSSVPILSPHFSLDTTYCLFKYLF